MKKVKFVLLSVAVLVLVFAAAACADKRPKKGYTVEFDSAGGSAVATQTVDSGKAATRPEDPERTGWNFVSWLLAGEEYDFSQPVTGDIKLTASYTSVLGGTGSEDDPFTIDSDSELSLMHDYVNAGLSEFVSGAYVQTADLTADFATPMTSFSGAYDGGGHTVNLSKSALFGTLSGRVKNLKVNGALTVSGSKAGVLALTAHSGAEVWYVTASGTLTAPNAIAGGIVGENGGAIINCISTVTVNGESAGGIAGVLESGGLIQNSGFGASVTGSENAGGIVGIKESGSSVYRAFLYGTGKIIGKVAGGIAGSAKSDIRSYEDVLGCVVNKGVAISSVADVTVLGGEAQTGESVTFSGMGLPSYAWEIKSGLPVLKADISSPSSVTITVDGENKSVDFGSLTDGDMFASGAHFSALNRVDSPVALTRVEAKKDMLAGGYTDGEASIAFGDSTALYIGGANAENKTLTYDCSLISFGSYETALGETVVYAQPYHIYTCGNTDYIIAVIKEHTSAGYVGELAMFASDGEDWDKVNSWSPDASRFSGVYKISARDYYAYLIIDGKNAKHYDSDMAGYVLSEGYATLYFGTGANGDCSPAFVYGASETDDEVVDFVYYADGNLISAAYNSVYAETDELLNGSWYDLTNKYTFSAEADTVSVNGGAATPYTFAGGKITFAAGGKNYELTFGLSESGNNKIYGDGGELNAFAYYYDLFDGVWRTGSGKAVTVSSSNGSVVVGSATASEVHEGLYNETQALYFTAGGSDYILVQSVGLDVATLIGDTRELAVCDSAVGRHFAGTFVTVYDGESLEITVDGLNVSLKVGDGAEVTGSVLPKFDTASGEISLDVSVGGNSYTAVRKDDEVVEVTESDSDIVYAFTSPAVLARFVVSAEDEYSNGAQMLEITADGKFALYERGESAGEWGNLTAIYNAQSAQNDGCGLVLSHNESGEVKFFTAGVEARDIRYYTVVNGSRRERSGFVPDSYLTAAAGEYIRYNGYGDDGRDIIRFDGVNMTRTYSDAFGNSYTDRVMEWYPKLGYNSLTQSASLMITEVSTVGANIYMESTGWQVGASGVYYFADFYPFTRMIYKNTDNEMLKVGGASVTIGDKSYTVKTLNPSAFGFLATLDTREGTSKPAEFTFKDGEYTVTTTAGRGTYTGEEIMSYKPLLGEYKHEDTEYSFTEETFFTTSVTLSFSVGSANYNFTYDNENLIATDGRQVLVLYDRNHTDENNRPQIRYVWGDGAKLVISESLDLSRGITATNGNTPDIPPVIGSELDKESLNGLMFRSAAGNRLSFSYTDFFGESFVMLLDSSIYDFESESASTNGFDLVFKLGGTKLYVHLSYSGSSVSSVNVKTSPQGLGTLYTPAVAPSYSELAGMLGGKTFTGSDGSTAKFTYYTGFGSVLELEIEREGVEFTYNAEQNDYDEATKIWTIYFEEEAGVGTKWAEVYLDDVYNIDRIYISDTEGGTGILYRK